MNVILRYGRTGEQLASVVRVTPSGTYVVRKWRRNSCSWTGDVRVHPSQVLREASADESALIGRDLATRLRAGQRYALAQAARP